MKHEFMENFAYENVQSVAVTSMRSSYGAFGKRLFDLVLSVTLLTVIVPVLAVIWAIGMMSGGRVFYAQDRVGVNGKIFRCYKVRTMVVDAEKVLAKMCSENPEVKAEWDEFQKLTDDPRITRMGRILRKTSLDELPQIWNVLRGEMSLVGPRPFMTNQDSLYTDAGGRAYYAMRPGITGEWQVHGRGKTSFASRVAYDNVYYERMSLWYDVKMMFGTINVVLKPTGS